MTDADWKLFTVFESSITVAKDRKLASVFNDSLLNHIIQYEDDSGYDMPTKKIKYRVIIEFAD